MNLFPKILKTFKTNMFVDFFIWKQEERPWLIIQNPINELYEKYFNCLFKRIKIN